MAKKRAPNCPSISLPDAIEKTERVYSFEGRNTFDGENAVRHIGYTGLNGASRRALGALRSYGLITGRGKELKVSEDAIVIIVDAQSSDQNERQAALLRALSHNRVFADLVKSFGASSTLPKITAFLQKHYDFKSNAARRTAKMYKDSVAIVHWSAVNPSYDASPEPAGDRLPLPSSSQPESAVIPVPNEPEEANPITSIGLSDTGSRTEVFTIDEGEIRLNCPEAMSPESFEDFTDWLLIMHRRISRKVEGESNVELKKQDAD